MAECLTITGRTQAYDPVAQVHTPPAFNAALLERGIDAIMVPMDLDPESVRPFLSILRGWSNCGGLSVTIPHKRTVFQALADATPAARRAGSTNIVRREPDGRLVGDMTDGAAFVEALARNGFDLRGRTGLLVGAGRAVCDALCAAGIGALWMTDVDLAANASPLGMSDADALPFALDVLADDALVADVVTKPIDTALLCEARCRGLRTQTGIEMADAQIIFQMRHLGLWTHRENG